MEDVNIILNYNTPIQTIDDWNDINLIEPSIHGESCINFEEYSECIFYPSDIDIFVSYKQTEKENLLKELHFKHETDMEDDEEKYKTSSSDSDYDYNHEDEKLKLRRRKRKSHKLKNNKNIKSHKQRKSQKRSGKTNCKWKFVFKFFGLISCREVAKNYHMGILKARGSWLQQPCPMD